MQVSGPGEVGVFEGVMKVFPAHACPAVSPV